MGVAEAPNRKPCPTGQGFTETRWLTRGSHPLVGRTAAPLPRQPAGAEHVGGLAVHAVWRIDDQLPTGQLVHGGGTHVLVEHGNLRRNVGAHDEVRWDVVAGLVARLEDRVHFAEGQLAVGDEWGGGGDRKSVV